MIFGGMQQASVVKRRDGNCHTANTRSAKVVPCANRHEGLRGLARFPIDDLHRRRWVEPDRDLWNSGK